MADEADGIREAYVIGGAAALTMALRAASDDAVSGDLSVMHDEEECTYCDLVRAERRRRWP